MMRMFGALVFAVVTLVVPPALAQQWLIYQPQGIGYSVEMPGKWAEQVQDIPTAVGSVKLYIAAVDLGPKGFASMYSQYPDSAIRGRPASAILDGGRDGAVSNVKGKLRTQEDFTLSNFPGRMIIIDAPDGGVIVMRYFLMNNTLVQAIAAGPKGVESEPDTRRFLSSLKVVGSLQ